MRRKSAIAMCSLLLTSVVTAQTIYESSSGQGKVYSDRPTTGSKPVELRPLNVIEPTQVAPASPKAPAAEEPKAAAPALAYRSLAVVFPEQGGSVAANTATFEVRVSIDPPLQIGKGHAFVLRLDGRTVGIRYTSTEMMVPPEFFGDVIPAGAQRHLLEVSVVDGQGSTVLAATPVDFQTRFVTQLQRPHLPRVPATQPVFPPRPAPKPAPALSLDPVPDNRRPSGLIR
jgi:hypothetical protein